MKQVDPKGWGWSSVSVVRLDTIRSCAPAPVTSARDMSETLLLIEVPQALPLIDQLPKRPSVVIARFSGLDKALLDRVSPNRVICPLISCEFDAMEVLKRLRSLRWKGAVEVVGPEMANPAMIETELRSALPGRNVSLLRSQH